MLILRLRHRVGQTDLYTGFRFLASVALIVTTFRKTLGIYHAPGVTESLIISGQGDLAGVKLGDTLERIDFRHGLVGA
jgi:hypothetical protein